MESARAKFATADGSSTRPSDGWRQHLPRRYRNFRHSVYHFLECSTRGRGPLCYHIAICTVIIAVFVVHASVDNDKSASSTNANVVSDAKFYLALFFVAEYLTRFWAAGANLKFRHRYGRLRYLLRPVVLMDTVTFAAAAASITMDMDSDSPAFLFAVILRFPLVDRRMRAWRLVRDVARRSRTELLAAYYITSVVFVTLAVVAYTLDDPTSRGTAVRLSFTPVDDDPAANATIVSVVYGVRFANMGEAFWLSVVSILTIGYGDIVPDGWPARVGVCMLAYLGASLFAAASGIVGVGMSLSLHNQNRARQMAKRRELAARLIQAWYRFHMISDDWHFARVAFYRKACARLEQVEQRIRRARQTSQSRKRLLSSKTLYDTISITSYQNRAPFERRASQSSAEILSGIISSVAGLIPDKIAQNFAPKTPRPSSLAVLANCGRAITVATAASPPVSLRNAAILNAAANATSASQTIGSLGGGSPRATILEMRSRTVSPSATVSSEALGQRTGFVKQRANSVPIDAPMEPRPRPRFTAEPSSTDAGRDCEAVSDQVLIDERMLEDGWMADRLRLPTPAIYDERKLAHYRNLLRINYFFAFRLAVCRLGKSNRTDELASAEDDLAEMERQRMQKFKELEAKIYATVGEQLQSTLSDALQYNRQQTGQQQQMHDRWNDDQQSVQYRLELCETKARQLDGQLDDIERLARQILANLQFDVAPSFRVF